MADTTHDTSRLRRGERADVEWDGAPAFGVVPRHAFRKPADLVHIYGLLATYANPGGECWPALDTLAEEAGVDVRTVMRRLARLEADGGVRRYPGGGRGHSTRYVLNWKWGARAPVPESPETGASVSGNRGAGAPGTNQEQTTTTPPTPPDVLEGVVVEDGAPAPEHHPAAGDEGETRAQAVMRLFNAAFQTRHTDRGWERRIERRWPKGWTVEDWGAAMMMMARDPWWERTGVKRPHPGMLLGRDGTHLLALRAAWDDAAAAAQDTSALGDDLDAMTAAARSRR